MDIFAAMGMKIVVSGTDSLGFAMAERDELYDKGELTNVINRIVESMNHRFVLQTVQHGNIQQKNRLRPHL